MKDCIFCSVVDGDLPSTKIFEDDYFIAMLDINPVSPGHTLVVTKGHYKNLYETPDDMIGPLFILTKRLAAAVKEGTGADGTNIIVNNDPAAGQIIHHFHLHIIPRFNDDGLKAWHGGVEKYEGSQAVDMATKIKTSLGE